MQENIAGTTRKNGSVSNAAILLSSGGAVLVRDAADAEKSELEPLVLQSWLRTSYSHGAGFGHTKDDYCARLSRPCSEALYAGCLDYISVEGETVAWVLSCADVLLYAYTKGDFRGQGFMSELVDEPFGFCAFRGGKPRAWLANRDRWVPWVMLGGWPW